MISIRGFDISGGAVALGISSGVAYGAIAVGLILVFRSTRVLNLALGEIGASGAVFLAVAVGRWNWPYWATLPVALAVAAGTAALVNVTVVERLRDAPAVVALIATLGVGQVLFFASGAFGGHARRGWAAMHPPGFPNLEVGGLVLNASRTAALVLVPTTVLLIAAFLKHHPWGRALRAASVNPDLARASGVSPSAMSSLAWAAAGGLAALVAILLTSSEAGAPQTLGFWLLLRGLAAALVAGMQRLPRALLAGLVIGVIEHLVFWNTSRSELRDVVLLVFVVVVAALQRVPRGRGYDGARWMRLTTPAPVRRGPRSRPRATLAGLATTGMLALLAVSPPPVATRLTFVFTFAIVGLSVLIVSALAGDLSLAQFAVSALGGLASIKATAWIGNFGLGLLAAALVGAMVAFALGAVTARAEAHTYVVVSLAFATAAQTWILENPSFYGEGLFSGQPVVGSFVFDSARRYAYFAFAVLLLAYAVTSQLSRRRLGRELVAQRDNLRAAQAFGISPRKARLEGHAAAGAVAGLGGAAFVHSLSYVTPEAFPVTASVSGLAVAAVGGLNSVLGPVAGSLYIAGLPGLLPDGAGLLATTALGWLGIVLAFPGGLAQAAGRLDLGRRGALTATPEEAALPAQMRAVTAERRPATDAPPVLAVRAVSRRFGDVAALQTVDLAVRRGEVVAIVGPNGAGKSTLVDVISGFEHPDGGRVLYRGVDVTALPPRRRAAMGIARSFEDAPLFPTLTVTDAVHLAVEHRRRDPSAITEDPLLRAGRASRERADELVCRLGLGAAADRRIGEISMGMRRLAELACVLGLQAELLLLDEPTSGLAQAEVAVLTDALARLLQGGDLTAVIVDHDLRFVRRIADRILVMEHGRVTSAVDPGALWQS